MLNRRVVLGLGVALLLLMAARHPSAEIRVLTHDAGDDAPHRIQAALDLGILAVNVLVTWTGKNLS